MKLFQAWPSALTLQNLPSSSTFEINHRCPDDLGIQTVRVSPPHPKTALRRTVVNPKSLDSLKGL